LLQEVYLNSPGEVIYKRDIVLCTLMDVVGEGPHTRVYEI